MQHLLRRDLLGEGNAVYIPIQNRISRRHQDLSIALYITIFIWLHCTQGVPVGTLSLLVQGPWLKPFTFALPSSNIRHNLLIRGEKREIGPVGGPEAIAGLESLVRQTQWVERGFMIVPRIKLFINHRSNSLYRSAAALTALMRLSTTSPSFGKFYFAISNSVPLFRLEARANALNVSKPDKTLFLSVVALGRARLPAKDRARLKSESVAHSLRKDLLRTLEYNQYVYSFNYIMVITQVS